MFPRKHYSDRSASLVLSSEKKKKVLTYKMLTATQQSQRKGRLTASMVGCLMKGESDGVLNLWRGLVGDSAYMEPNLDEIWAVQLGSATESLHLDWLQRKQGPILRRGEVVQHPNGWASATLDGWACDLETAVEVKHTGGHEKREVIIQRYLPQMHWLMSLTNTKRILFSVIEGAREPSSEIIELDETYNRELWSRAESFMDCVRSLRPPVELPPVAAPVKPIREYDMSSSNTFVSNAASWLLNKVAARDFEDAAKSLKEAVPADAQRCHGGGVEVKRNKAGNLTIKEIK